MLRLPPSTLPLTRSEVLHWQIRTEQRHRAEYLRALEQQNYVTYSNSSHASTGPRLRIGAQRSVTYRTSPVPSRASSQPEDTSTESNSSFQSHGDSPNENAQLLNDEAMSRLAKLHRPRQRRDSVLSHDFVGRSNFNDSELGPYMNTKRDTATWTAELLRDMDLAGPG